jgi:hypothetical protein
MLEQTDDVIQTIILCCYYREQALQSFNGCVEITAVTNDCVVLNPVRFRRQLITPETYLS